MAKNGGKESSVRRGKAALKTPASKSESLKGKDNITSDKGRQGKFDSDSDDSVLELDEGSSKAGGKASYIMPKTGKKASFESLKLDGNASFETPAGKGDWSKAGGKGSIPRTSEAKILTEVELKLEPELPKNSKILMDCEAAKILQGIQEYLQSLSEDPMIKIPESFGKALQYVKTVNYYKNPPSVRQSLQEVKKNGATDGEICMIANVCPETVDEVYALIPSLKDNKSKNEGPIVDALADLSKLKDSN